MPPRRLVLAFVVLWFTLGLALLYFSVQTFLGALHGGHGGGANPHLALLAGVETVAAVLFLIPRTMRAGGAGLLLTFAIALIAHALMGEFPVSLVLYGVGTAFVMIHGTVPWSWVRSRPVEMRAS